MVVSSRTTIYTRSVQGYRSEPGMDVLALNYWLSKFVVELAKKSGERYPLKTVYGITCVLKRYLDCLEENLNGSEALNPLEASDKR